MNLPLKFLALAVLAVCTPGLAGIASAQSAGAPLAQTLDSQGRSWGAPQPYGYGYPPGYEYGYPPGYGYDYAPGYGYSDYSYAAPGPYASAPAGADVGYCMQRFKSYDPASGTYLGYDGMRHPCP